VTCGCADLFATWIGASPHHHRQEAAHLRFHQLLRSWAISGPQARPSVWRAGESPLHCHAQHTSLFRCVDSVSGPGAPLSVAWVEASSLHRHVGAVTLLSLADRRSEREGLVTCVCAHLLAAWIGASPHHHRHEVVHSRFHQFLRSWAISGPQARPSVWRVEESPLHCHDQHTSLFRCVGSVSGSGAPLFVAWIGASPFHRHVGAARES